MIVWLNGAFGAGKTTVAQELVDLLPGSVLYDPKPIATGLRAVLPKERLSQVADVQELPAWRRLVADGAAAVLSEVTGPLITPMTLLRQEYRDEIFGSIAAARIPVRHILLHAEETILRARIDQLAASGGESGRARRLSRLDQYCEALPWLTQDAHTLDTSGLTPRQTAQRVVEAIERGAGECPIVQSARPTAETVAAGVLLFDEQDRVLLVDPTYKPGWEFPGGVVEPGEPPARAGVREVAEELELTLERPLRLLVVDWEPPSRTGYGGLRLLFDGGLLSAERAERLLLPVEELRDWRFVTEAEAAGLLSATRLRRLRWALHARARGCPLNLEAGEPAG